ncbi:MAG: hypothetical protein VX899_07115 [Myxococcota bacterium]|nr:hypothetical protein [Myxococcota bacterium]
MATLGLLSLAGCLERTTGEPAALDPRFTAGESEGPTQIEHDPNAGPTAPFGQVEGPTVVVRGSLTSSMEGSVDLDVMTLAPGTEAGVELVGKILFPSLGDFELELPQGEGTVILQFFQDIGPSGPDDGDPFLGTQVVVEDQDLDLGELELVVGARATTTVAAARSHVFPDHDGAWTLLEGEVVAERKLPIAVDLRRPDPSSQTGDAFIGKEQLPAPGRFAIPVPQGSGRLTLQFFQDAGGDGPSPDDPFAQVQVEVDDQDRMELEVVLQSMASTAPTPGQPGTPTQPAPGTPEQQGAAEATP